MNSEELGQAGHCCNASYVWLLRGDDEGQLLAACLDRVSCSHEQGDHRGIDERAVAQINEHVGVRGSLLERGSQDGNGAEVVLTANGDDS